MTWRSNGAKWISTSVCSVTYILSFVQIIVALVFPVAQRLTYGSFSGYLLFTQAYGKVDIMLKNNNDTSKNRIIYFLYAVFYPEFFLTGRWGNEDLFLEGQIHSMKMTARNCERNRSKIDLPKDTIFQILVLGKRLLLHTLL
jgi:hypothetical protein